MMAVLVPGWNQRVKFFSQAIHSLNNKATSSIPQGQTSSFCSKKGHAEFVSVPAQLPKCFGDRSFRQMCKLLNISMINIIRTETKRIRGTLRDLRGELRQARGGILEENQDIRTGWPRPAHLPDGMGTVYKKG